MKKCPKCGHKLNGTFEELFKVGDQIKRVKGHDTHMTYLLTAIGATHILAVREISNQEQKFIKDADYWELVKLVPQLGESSE